MEHTHRYGALGDNQHLFGADMQVPVGDFVSQSYADGSQAQHHITDLADGGISQHAFNIISRQTHGSGKDSRKPADNGDEGNSIDRVDEERHHSRHQEDTGADHGGGMDKGADRGRTLHGIRQPYVQRELGALADSPGKEPDSRPGKHHTAQDTGHRQVM